MAVWHYLFQAGIMEEMMEDTLESALGDTDEMEEEAQEEIDKVRARTSLFNVVIVTMYELTEVFCITDLVGSDSWTAGTGTKGP